MPIDESEADDGAIHRFWRFVILRAVAVGDLDNLVVLLLLIVLFDQVADTIAEPT